MKCHQKIKKSVLLHALLIEWSFSAFFFPTFFLPFQKIFLKWIQIRFVRFNMNVLIKKKKKAKINGKKEKLLNYCLSWFEYNDAMWKAYYATTDVFYLLMKREKKKTEQ